MLVLTRRVSDQVLVPSLGITLEVLSIKGNVVKLGIRAPQEVRVLRGELADKPLIFQRSQTSSTPPQNLGGNAADTESRSTESPEASPLGEYVRKGRVSQAHTNAAAKTKSAQALIYRADDTTDSVCETKTAYEVCI